MELKLHFSPKGIWLLILMLLSVNLWSMVPFAGIFSVAGIIVYLAWLIAGHFLFKPMNKWASITWSTSALPALLMYLGVLLSFIPAFVYYGQDPLTSFIATRSMWSLLTLPVLFAVKPGISDIKWSVNVFVILFCLFTFVDSILDIPVLDREVLAAASASKSYIMEGDFVHLLDGYWWIAVAMAFQLDALKKGFDTEAISFSLLLFLVLFITQSRTMMMAALAMMALAALSMKGMNRTNTIIFRSAVVVLMGLVLVILAGNIGSLIQETLSDLGNDEYNRALAMVYYLTEAPSTFLKAILGCGFISANVSPVMQDLMAEGIYNTDVGLVGQWNYFGLLPVLTILFFVIRLTWKKRSSLLVVNYALLLAASFFTLGCFTDPAKILWLMMFFYLAVQVEEDKTIEKK